MEEPCAQHERQHDREAPHQGCHRDGDARQRKPVEVQPVRPGQQYADHRNRPAPLEPVAPDAEGAAPSEEEPVHDHQPYLKEQLHRIHGRAADLEHVLVPYRRESGEERARGGAPDSLAPEEVNALVPSRPGEDEVSREDGDHAKRLHESGDLSVKK